MSDVTVHEASSASNHYFLALETKDAGTTREISRPIVVPEGAGIISVFLTELSGTDMILPEDAVARLIDPEGHVHERGTPLDFAQLIHVPNPRPGVWGVEIDVEEHAHFCCEVRIMPNASAEDGDTLSRDLIEFGRRLPETKFLAHLKQLQSSVAADDDCQSCIIAVTVLGALIGLAALILAALAYITIGAPAFGSIAALIVILVAEMGALILFDTAKGLLVALRDEIWGRPSTIFSVVGLRVCQAIRYCPSDQVSAVGLS